MRRARLRIETLAHSEPSLSMSDAFPSLSDAERNYMDKVQAARCHLCGKRVVVKWDEQESPRPPKYSRHGNFGETDCEASETVIPEGVSIDWSTSPSES